MPYRVRLNPHLENRIPSPCLMYNMYYIIIVCLVVSWIESMAHKIVEAKSFACPKFFHFIQLTSSMDAPLNFYSMDTLPVHNYTTNIHPQPTPPIKPFIENNFKFTNTFFLSHSCCYHFVDHSMFCSFTAFIHCTVESVAHPFAERLIL